MPDLIEAIERFERDLRDTSLAPRSDAAELALRAAIVAATRDDHDEACEDRAEGCAEGIVFRGTIYTAGHTETGRPCVVVMRRTRDAETLEAVTLSERAYV